LGSFALIALYAPKAAVPPPMMRYGACFGIACILGGGGAAILKCNMLPYHVCVSQSSSKKEGRKDRR